MFLWRRETCRSGVGCRSMRRSSEMLLGSSYFQHRRVEPLSPSPCEQMCKNLFQLKQLQNKKQDFQKRKLTEPSLEIDKLIHINRFNLKSNLKANYLFSFRKKENNLEYYLTLTLCWGSMSKIFTFLFTIMCLTATFYWIILVLWDFYSTNTFYTSGSFTYVIQPKYCH